MNQNKALIVDRLQQLFTETFYIDIPSPQTDLLDEGVLDSFQFVELLIQLEQQWGVEVDIQEIDLDNLRTLERIAEVVEKRGVAINGATSAGP